MNNKSLRLPRRAALAALGCVVVTSCGSSAVTSGTAKLATPTPTPTAVVTPTPTSAPVHGAADINLHAGAPAVNVGMVNRPGAQDIFSPADVTVAVGAIVQWTYDPLEVEGHNVTFRDAYELSSPSVSFGQRPNGAPGIPSWQVRFSVPGTYHYFCTFHTPSMVGTITVTG